MANLSNINNKFLVTTTGEVLIGQTSNNGNRLQITGADGASYIYLKTDVATTGGRIGFNSDDLRVFNQQASGELQLGTAGTSRVSISNSLVVFPTITELRGDIAAKFAIGNMGGASSQMMVSSRGFLTLNVSNTGSALDATERMRITSAGNVGIGTSSPAGIFHVDGDGASTYITNQKSSTKFSEWHVGGSDHYLLWDSTGDLRFGTETGLGGAGASEKMRIESDGKIQIGSDKVIWAGGYGGGLVIRQNNATGDRLIKMVTVDSTGAIVSDNVLVAKGANVGIGTDSPSAALEVKVANPRVKVTATTGTNPSYLNINNTGGSTYAGQESSVAGSEFTGTTAYASVFGSSSSRDTQFLTNTTVRMTIDTSGNVGIGTASPAYKLHVADTGDDTLLKIENTTVNKYPHIRFTALGAEYDIGVGGTGTATGYVNNLYIYDITNSAPRITLTQAGNVGIGTTININAPLTVQADGSAYGINLIGRSNGVYDESVIGFYDNDGTTRKGYILNSAGNMYFATGGSTENMVIDSSGNVGIGTTVATGGFNVNNTSAGSYYNMSNSDSGNYKYTNAGGRLLTSNATGWFADGRDPILTLSTSGNSNNSAIGNSIGLNLYTNSATHEVWSPLITFSALSDSGSYASAYAAIAGRKVNRGPDTNWNTGDLCFWTTGPEASNPASYMQQTPSMVIQTGGNVGIGTDSPTQKLDVVGIVKHLGLDMSAGIQVDQITSITKTLNGALNTWHDTGIYGSDIGANGSYMIQIYNNVQQSGVSNYAMYWTGTMSWYYTGTNSVNTSEIYLNSAGHYRGMDLELRTISNTTGTTNPYMSIQFRSNQTLTNHPNFIFKFRRLM